MTVHEQRPADRILIRVEARAPQAFGDDDHRPLELNAILVGRKKTPERGTDAEHVEEVAGHESAIYLAGVVTRRPNGE